MTDDVVAELDRWLDRNPVTDRVLTLAALVQRARDEIVVLRATKVLPGWTDALQQTRDQALEEAARACVGSGAIGREARLCAVAIRLLKEK